MKYFSTLLFFLLLSSSSISQITVESNNTPQELIETITDDGVTISNISINCNERAYGIFNATNAFVGTNSTNVGLQGGVVLATGNAKPYQTQRWIQGPNNGLLSTQMGNQYSINDPDLVAIDAGDYKDVCAVEFDLVPICDTLGIRYVFASEEYPNYVCASYNDIFAFFISGPGINGPYTNNAINIATVPDNQNLFVGINTINDGNSTEFNNSCPNGGLDNTEYFIDNGQNCTGNPLPSCTNNQYLIFNGMTVPLIASTPVQSGQTYHMKLIIADKTDGSFDSAVFLELEGLQCIGSTSNISSNQDTIVESCNEVDITIAKGGNINNSITVNLSYEGNAISGTDYTPGPTSIVLDSAVLDSTFTIAPIVDNLNEGFEELWVKIEYPSPNNIDTIIRDSVKIVIADLPSLSLDTTFSTCNQNNGTITATLSHSFNPLNVSWTGNVNNQTGMQIQNLVPGNYSINITDRMECSYTADTVIANIGNLSIEDSIVNNICAGDCLASITITPQNQIGNIIYQWKDLLGNNIGTNVNIINELCEGKYIINVMDDYCSVTDTFQVTQPDSVKITSTNDTIICQNGTATVQIIASNGVLPYTFNWGDANFSNPRSFNPTQDTVIRFFVRDNNQCMSKMDSVQISLLPPLAVEVNENKEICFGDTVKIVATATGGKENYTYLWISENQTTPQINVIPPSTLSYIVRVSDACETTPVLDSLKITVNYATIPNIIIDPKEGCEPLEVKFQDLNSVKNQSCLWNFGDETISTNCDTIIKNYNKSGNYLVDLKTISNKGCDTIFFVDTIKVYPKPIINFTHNPFNPTMFNAIAQYNNLSIGANTFWWNFGSLATPKTSTLKNPQVIYPDGKTGVYPVFLKAITEHNCVDSMSTKIEIIPELIIYAPNTFTPDNDEFNQKWKIIVDGVDVNKFELEVYNRWGEIVWKTNTPNAEWNGKYKGKLVESGTYIWKLTTKDLITDKKYQFKGHLTILY